MQTKKQNTLDVPKWTSRGFNAVGAGEDACGMADEMDGLLLQSQCFVCIAYVSWISGWEEV